MILGSLITRALFRTTNYPIKSAILLNAGENRVGILENSLLLRERFGLRNYPIDLAGFDWISKDVFNGEATFVLTEVEAVFLSRLGAQEYSLVDAKAQRFWKIHPNELWKFQVLPLFFGDTWDTVYDVMRQFLEFPLFFRNYLSSVDVDGKVLYIRNGNVLYVNSWQNLNQLDIKEFIGTMGQRKYYDLFSNGLYFPINRKP